MRLEQLDSLLKQLPKVELHLHLDGSVKPETMLDFARDAGITLPATDPQGLIPYMQVNDQCGSLKEYLNKFDIVLPFLQTAEAVERVAYEVVEQMAEHNVRYVEVRFAPQLHRHKGMTVDETIESVLRGLKRGEKDFGVKARGIAICMRHHTLEQNLDVIEAAATYMGKGIVAVDLAGDESSYSPEQFQEVFAKARQLGLPITIHAGEAAGPSSIYEAVMNLGAIRIGHGVRLKESSSVLQLVKQRRIPLEMCPTSNIQTKAVPSWKVYPLRDYFNQGLMVTVNTDNPTVSGTNLTKEYRILVEKFGFTPRELAAIILNGAEAAFLKREEKEALKKELQVSLKKLGVL